MDERKPAPKASKPRRDDLPAIGVSRLRATGLITPAMKTIRLELEARTFDIGLVHTHFPKGGGWSFFVCPSCSRFARTLRLLERRLVCRRCDGLLARCQMEDKGPRIKSLIERLNRPKAKNRARLERSLRQALIADRRKRLKGWK